MSEKILEQSSVKDRLLEYVKHLNIPISRFEKNVGFSNGFINNIRKDIGQDKLEQISNRYPELNTAWLKLGIGSMLENTKTDKGLLPVFDIYGKAGLTEFVNTMDNFEILGYVKVPGYENCLGWVKVKGDSMSPYLNSGDMVAIRLVDRNLISWGNVYFIVFNGEFAPEPMIKYVRKGKEKNTFILRSHNEKYEDMEVNGDAIKNFYAVRGGVIEIQ